MGTFHYQFEIGDASGARFERVDGLVDTGATYTSVPRDILQSLGVQPEEERPFFLANGQRVIYPMAWVRLRLDSKEQPTLVIFGDVGSPVLLGAFTLEGLGLSVDTVNRRLVPATAYLVGIREAT